MSKNFQGDIFDYNDQKAAQKVWIDYLPIVGILGIALGVIAIIAMVAQIVYVVI